MCKAKPARKAKRPYQRLAEKHASHTNGNGAALHALALDNLVHAGIALRAAIGASIHQDTLLPDLGPAVELYDRAQQIHAAAKNA